MVWDIFKLTGQKYIKLPGNKNFIIFGNGYFGFSFSLCTKTHIKSISGKLFKSQTVWPFLNCLQFKTFQAVVIVNSKCMYISNVLKN